MGTDAAALEAEFSRLVDALVDIEDDSPASDRHREPIEARLDVVRSLLVAAEHARVVAP